MNASGPAVHDDASSEVAYILKGFPRLTETFISHEIYQLEQMGLALRIFSIKPGDTEKVDGVVERIRAGIRYLPQATSTSNRNLFAWLLQNAGTFLPSHARLASRRPLRYLSTALQAAHMSWRYRVRGGLSLRKVFIKEFLQAGAIAADLLDQPRVRHLHGHFCHGATTVTWFASRLSGLPFSFTAHAKDIYQPSLNPQDLLPRKMLAARFIATCTAANERHLRSVCPQCQGVHTIYHGLDLQRFTGGSDAARDRAVSVPLVLAVGRLVQKKGFDILVEACARLRDSGVPFRCVIVGERGDASETVGALIARHRLEDVISLTGPVAQKDLVDIYRQASVFALPCLVTEDGDRDGIPNVLVEAMAMGVPVISTPISGIPELIDDGSDGLLVADRDADALAAALRRLLTDGELRDRLGARARQKVRSRFDARQTTKALFTLFEQAMDGQSERRSVALSGRAL